MRIDDCSDIPPSLRKCFGCVLAGVDISAMPLEEYQALDTERPVCVDRESAEYKAAYNQVDVADLLVAAAASDREHTLTYA